MRAKTSPARRAAFLRALAATGNISLAAERANVSRSWAISMRARDADFARDCAAALATARARFAGAASATLPAGWTHQDGELLVVRAGNGRRAVVARARAQQWTAQTERRFLETLGATCNVRAACAAAGLSVASAYNRRNKWNGFRARWDTALETGYVRLEMALIENACDLMSGVEPSFDAPMPPMRVQDAIHLLYLHRPAICRTGRRPGRAMMKLPDIEVVRAEILRKVAVINRARAAGIFVK
jgi:hypothetical protein